MNSSLDRVLVRNLRDGPHWLQGTIIERKGPLSYLVQLTSGAVWRRHIDHILESVDSPQEEPVTPEPVISVPEELPSPSSIPVDVTPPTVPVTEQSDISTDETAVSEPAPVLTDYQSETVQTPPRRYPQRQHRPPERYRDLIW